MLAAQFSGSASVRAVAEPPTVRGLADRSRGHGGPAAWSVEAEELLEAQLRLEPGARVLTSPGAVALRRDRQRVFVPGSAQPVLLSPPRGRTVAASRRRVDATTTIGETVGMLRSQAWTSLTGGRHLRDRVALTDGSGGLAEHLGEVLGHPVTYSMRIDEARTSRRPVLQLHDERGHVVGYANLGMSRASRLDLDAEATALATVGARQWTRLAVPRVLARTVWDGTDVLVTSALHGSWWQGSARRRTEPPVEAMGELSTAWTEESVRLDEMGWMQRQQEVAATLRSRGSRVRFGDAIERLLTDARRTTWPVGAWHGDWTAQHMARRGEQVQVWSWTRFETGVPMGLDPCHFVVAARTDRDGFTPTAVRDGLREALRRQHGPGASVMGALYLVAVTSRELLLAEGPGGHRVAARAEVLLATLENWFADRV